MEDHTFIILYLGILPLFESWYEDRWRNLPEAQKFYDDFEHWVKNRDYDRSRIFGRIL